MLQDNSSMIFFNNVRDANSAFHSVLSKMVDLCLPHVQKMISLLSETI